METFKSNSEIIRKVQRWITKFVFDKITGTDYKDCRDSQTPVKVYTQVEE